MNDAPALPESLWAMEPRALERLRLAASQPMSASMFGRSGVAPDAPLYTVEGGVAVIKFEGMVSKRPSFWSWLFGGSAVTETAQQALAQALADITVRSVLFVIDSPGGTVAGTEELAEAVFRARSVKPVTAFASDMCASAAYWIAAQASKVYANATAMVGSIGVYAVNVDLSRMYTMGGVEVDVIKSAPGKGHGVRGMPFTPDMQADMQREIDALGAEFVAAIQRARPKAVAAADGRCFSAREGLPLGLVDGITTLSDLLGQLQAEANVWPPVTLTMDVEPEDDDECEPEPPGAATTSADERVAHDPAQQEEDMSDTQKPDAVGIAALTDSVAKMAATVDQIAGKFSALETDVRALKSERELETIIAKAKADRKIPNAETEASVRAVGEKSLDAARSLVDALKVVGPPGGSVSDGAPSAAGEAPDNLANFDAGRLAIDRKAKEYAKEHDVTYQAAVVAVTRR